MTESVTQVPTTDPTVLALRIHGEIDGESMQSLSVVMNTAFDIHDRVRLLLIFDRFDGSSLGARLNFDGLKAQLRALSKIEKYAVVGGPDDSARSIKTATFDLSGQGAAWGSSAPKPGTRHDLPHASVLRRAFGHNRPALRCASVPPNGRRRGSWRRLRRCGRVD